MKTLVSVPCAHRVAGAVIMLATWCSLCPSARAQSVYEVQSSVIAGGGSTASGAGTFALGGTLGQPAAGAVGRTPFTVDAGFWPAASVSNTPTPTSVPTGSVTMTPPVTTPPSTATPTLPSGATATATPVPTESTQPTATPTGARSGTPMPSATTTPTPTPPSCAGDCRDTGSVDVSSLILLVNIALGTADPSACAHSIPSGGSVDISFILQAVNNALNGCP